VGFFQRLDHQIFANLFRPAFDHGYTVFGSGNDNFQRGILNLLISGIDHQFAVYLTNPNPGNGAAKGNVGDMHRG